MKCPHCGDVASHKVIETRKFEGSVYRRRRCNACSKGFVSVETTDTYMEMPAEVSWGGKSTAGRVRSTAAHLQGILS